MPKHKRDIDGSIGGRIRDFRKSEKLTQAQLGEHLSTSARAVQQWEYQKSYPDCMALQKFVEYGVNVNWLLTGKGPMGLLDVAFDVLPDTPSLSPQITFSNPSTFSLQLADNAMAPTYSKGDIVIVAPHSHLGDMEGPVVIDGPAGPTVRFVRRLLNDDRQLKTHNPSYPNEVLTANQAASFAILGKLVGHIRDEASLSS